ncbi:acyl-CoA dehydrogenase [Egibacter rhizosphaerae]|uniref:Acyl-CoA dehydrogenase n=1 Tax=Egibacter rhizosphaerae TaxID=1670831 RepID=A0A411YHT8_9ACTN|nr:acyl-CoA dehydrogenase family protein [Egibacter rhizosphaerae]QBI20676.1 acyl-CoA dehydrogenase [Egibacter rhizosphaerae]
MDSAAPGPSFALTDEQAELQRVVRQFARERVAPRAEAFNARAELPLDLVGEMGQMGLFGLPFPEEVGGSGGTYLDLCLALEEIGRVDQSLGITLEAAVGLGAMPIYRFGSDEQRERWLPPLARGEQLAGFGLTEPGGGSDAGALRTRARWDGDAWVIDGSKQFITNVGTDVSAFVTVAAVTADDPREITNFVVPTGTPGYVVGQGYRKVGWHASDTRDLAFSDCGVPADHQLGEQGRGLANFLSILSEGRIAIAALAVGLIQGCVDECVRYAQEREAFGKPIGAHQAVAFKIADMEAAAQLARNQYRYACWLLATGQRFTREAAIAKLHATEQAVAAAREACQVFGGYGFTTEYAVGRFYQDAKILEIGEGTSEVQRMLIARDLGLPR